jgi:leucyl aminopeptidase
MKLLERPVLSSVSPAGLDAALRGTEHDAVVVIGPGPLSTSAPAALRDAIAAAEKADATLGEGRAAVAVVPAREAPGGRLVLATTGNVSSWEVDVRAFTAAAAAGVTRASAAGAKRPLLVVQAPDGDARYARAAEAALLGAAQASWDPLEVRHDGERPARIEQVTVAADVDVERLSTLERGRIVARDVCGTEPESMAPEGMARYCERAFAGTAVKVEVLRDQALLARGYPLIAAVARASMPVERHHPRVIKLVYEPVDAVTRTIVLAGKGLTYDTGGADLKTDGHMAGMSRDKGGAAAVAGLLRVVAERKPKGVRVIGLLGAVRNSIGSDSFVTDEIIRSRAGVRVRIGNTDAEGRLVLADLLAALREEIEGAPSVTLLSVATLTGHAALAVGPYTALVENGQSRVRGIGDAIQRAGDAIGDPIERSTLRAEDYAFVAGKSAAEDVLSCNSLPSSRTPRGHQFPAAFLDIVSGMRAYEQRKPRELAFLHVDIAGSAVAAGNWQTGTPTGAPVLALAEGLGLL